MTSFPNSTYVLYLRVLKNLTEADVHLWIMSLIQFSFCNWAYLVLYMYSKSSIIGMTRSRIQLIPVPDNRKKIPVIDFPDRGIARIY